MHLKIQKAPKHWPIQRKSTRFIVKSGFSLHRGLPILVVLRDMLKVAQNRKEVKHALNAKNILLNDKPIRDEKHNVLLFDVVKIVPSKKSFRVEVSENKKFALKEVSEKDSDKKIAKVVNKKTLKGKKTQVNLSDGNNFLSDVKCKTNDSAVIDFKTRKIEKILPLKEKAEAVIFEGKHFGKKGSIEKIDDKNKIVEINTGKEKINVLIKQIMVIE